VPENDSTPSGRPESEAQSDREANASEPSPKPKVHGTVLRFATLGTELAACTLSGTAVGYFLDSARGHDKPYATGLGTLIGFTLGMVRFIHIAMKAQK
jgi:F0F1-type ATP synthase assembly protein I